MANFISVFRIFLIFIVTYLLYQRNMVCYIIAAVLTVIAFALDGVDGYVARKLNESSKLGAMLDIMSDRIVENTLWIALTALGWLPIAFPLISLTRGFLVDGIRSVAMEQGMTAFGETSMQEDKVGHFICASKFMRILYAVVKALGFLLLIVAATPELNMDLSNILFVCGYIAAMIALILCVVRGLPVVFESKKLFVKE